MFNQCDVVVVSFNLDIGIDGTQGPCCRFHFALAALMWLEEKPVHVCQLYFVVIEKNQLQ